MEHPVCLDLTENQEPRDRNTQREPQDHPDLQVQLESLVQEVKHTLKPHRSQVHQDHQDPQVTQEDLAHREPLESRELREHPEQTQLIAPVHLERQLSVLKNQQLHAALEELLAKAWLL